MGGDPACAAFQGDSHLSRNENKLARLAKERRERMKAGGFDVEPTVEEQLMRIEDDIRRLKVEFDIYFNGGLKRPPYDTKLRLESHLKRLGDDRTLNFAQRYHFNTLATRYNSFNQLWRRTLQDREEGRGTGGKARPLVRDPRDRARAAAARIRELRKGVTLGGLTVHGLFDGGYEPRMEFDGR